MDAARITTTVDAGLMVAVSAPGIYLALLLFTRMAGLRSFAKISGFDFAVTVAIGSLVATTLVAEDPPLLQAAVGLGSLYGLQMLVAVLRQHSPAIRAAVENGPPLDRRLLEDVKEARGGRDPTG